MGTGAAADAEALEVVPGSVTLVPGAAATLSASGSLIVGVGAAAFTAPSTNGWALQLRAILYGHQQPVTALAAYVLSMGRNLTFCRYASITIGISYMLSL